ncbi:A disintegrin and metalloproteinase with thrombospondin motifs 17 isoform X1 [Corythoichthys intestinalis]|uniref:A disintegrin and metalloproteinase with thrombospondin motifs 17 isoform X1 n=1 Tax=Corythoichthys intestinalis TaxID=161448 RepID=UPI0025A56FF7|nr:A disintegrin and metalloproteinase with thrombospondin motifs 17 isoform X1 [Corythoichthys intestinalis]
MRSGRVTRLLVALLCAEVSAAAAAGGDSPERTEVVPALLSALGAPERLLVSLAAFGEDLRLDARRNGDGGPPVEERRAGRRSPVAAPMDRNQLCLYSGTVRDRPGSLVSLTACGGLTALVHLSGEVLLIRPREGHNLTGFGSFSGVRHELLRRREASSRCGTAPEREAGQKKRKPSELGEEARGKRAPEDEYTVETLLVADSDMVRFHGADAAKRFLLTVMNMVYNMFQHQSLGVRINIRLTKLVLLHSRPEKLKVGHRGERSLESFCQWQHQEFGRPAYLGNNRLPVGREQVPAVDAAVLVTRTDFCVHKEEPCDTVGIAYLGGACSAKRKCVLAEDNGLNLAFTIAHELGHNMGMSHDDDHASCGGHAYIMSGEWLKGRNPSDLSWSSCSRDDLGKFLRSESSACLVHTDPRSRYQPRLPHKLPGMHYGAEQQCRILFGNNATFCTDMEHLMCAGLWCLVEGEVSCKTKLDPPLDGTQCGEDKWCRAGECVSKTPIPQHVDGDWSPWGPWSMCSRTCATGVQFRQRKCDNPPPGPGGQPCQKASVEHKACEGPPCPKGTPGFRDLQCLSYDRRAGGKKEGRVLTAVTDDEKPCALFCSPAGRDLSVLMADRVMDGTPCGPYEADLCVNGRCRKIGCDGIIGSSSREDVCGVCNGDGRSCSVVRGDFNHTRGMGKKRTSFRPLVGSLHPTARASGYVEAAVIPAGARRIKVVEDKPLHSFLALKDGGGRKSINSDWKIELPGEFQVAGTTVRYVRRGLWEKMSARGPTDTPLHLMVLLFHDQSYGIHYEYTLSLNASRDDERKRDDPLYIWTHSGWDACSAHCGGGERRTTVSCARLADKSREPAEDGFCGAETRPPPQVGTCNPQPCAHRWLTGEWDACSATCGEGTQRRRVTCALERRNGSLTPAEDAGRCPGPPPPPLRACEGRLCLGVWEASEWSQCSEGCGTGVRTRTVTCGNAAGLCDPPARPAGREACRDHSRCYEWKTGQWSRCSSSCGRGLQSRVVQCMHKVTGRHGDGCPPDPRPPAYRHCRAEGACRRDANAITSPRLAALTYKCSGDQWPVYCRVIRQKNLCQDMRWYQRCCQTCRDFYAAETERPA